MTTATWNGVVIAESDDIVTVEGNAYFPREAVRDDVLRPSEHHSVCPWKGTASYYSLEVDGQVNADAVWYYPEPLPGYESIAGYYAFYPALMEACIVDAELVLPQPGGFYGGWITSRVTGPFKGVPGSRGW